MTRCGTSLNQLGLGLRFWRPLARGAQLQQRAYQIPVGQDTLGVGKDGICTSDAFRTGRGWTSDVCMTGWGEALSQLQLLDTFERTRPQAFPVHSAHLSHDVYSAPTNWMRIRCAFIKNTHFSLIYLSVRTTPFSLQTWHPRPNQPYARVQCTVTLAANLTRIKVIRLFFNL